VSVVESGLKMDLQYECPVIPSLYAAIFVTDIAPGMIDEIQQTIKTNGWSNMYTKILDVHDLSTLRDKTFTHVITNLGLPVPGGLESSIKIVNEIFRDSKIGGGALVST
jgi:hypothetical protein